MSDQQAAGWATIALLWLGLAALWLGTWRQRHPRPHQHVASCPARLDVRTGCTCFTGDR